MPLVARKSQARTAVASRLLTTGGCAKLLFVGSVWACLVLAVLSGGADAVAAERATLTAVARAPLPQDALIAVEFREDSDLNNRLQAVFEQELRARGHEVSEGAALVLTFETLTEEGAGDYRPFSLYGQYGARQEPNVGFALQLPLSGSQSEAGGRRYHLNVTLATDGKAPLWSASAAAVSARRDRFLVQSALVKAVAGVLGQSVESRPVTLD